MRTIRTCILLLFLLFAFSALKAQRVEPTWESLNQRGYPQWFSDAKLGIFIHWGLYSVPAYASKEGYGEWFYRGLMTGDSGRCAAMSYYADPKLPLLEQYKKLDDHWHAELWQPDEWARLFRDAGAKYVLLVTKHHDGYCLWDSPQQPQWNSVVSGPRRNIVDELTDAVRRTGLRMGFYYSLPEWTNPLHVWMEDPSDSVERYVEEYMIPQFKDLVSRYRPDIIFSDGDWTFSADQLHSVELISWYYNTVGPAAIVNNRWGNGTRHGFITPEYSAGITNFDRPWAECRGLGRSFGLNRNESLSNFLTSTELIRHFSLLVSNGGGMTLNVGPNADGTIPFIQQERLLDLGRWLQVNGQAIYGSRGGGARYYTASILIFDSVINFDWVRNAPMQKSAWDCISVLHHMRSMATDHFSAHWVGRPQAPKPGRYQLEVEADDRMIVVVDGDTMIHYDKNDISRQRRSAIVEIPVGYDKVWHVYYEEEDLEAVARLRWRREGTEDWQPIAATVTGEWTEWRQPFSGWDAEYRFQLPRYCLTYKGDNSYVIFFERPRNKVEFEGLSRIPRSADITLLGTPQPLKWKQRRDGTLVVDLSSLSDSELAGLDHAWVFRIEAPDVHIIE